MAFNIFESISESFNTVVNEPYRVLIGIGLSLIYTIPTNIGDGLIRYSMEGLFNNYYGNMMMNEGLNSLQLLSPISMIGIFLFAIGLLLALIVGSILSGYYLRVSKETVIGSGDKLPNWNNWLDLFLNGFIWSIGVFALSLIMLIVFMIIPIIVGVIIYMVLKSMVFISMFVALLFLIPYFIFMWLYIPLGSVNYAVNGFWALFDFKKIIRLISIEYVFLLIVWTIITLIVGVIMSIIMFIFGFILLTLPTMLSHGGFDIIFNVIYEIIYSIFASITSVILGIVSYKLYGKYYRYKINEL